MTDLFKFMIPFFFSVMVKVAEGIAQAAQGSQLSMDGCDAAQTEQGLYVVPFQLKTFVKFVL